MRAAGLAHRRRMARSALGRCSAALLAVIALAMPASAQRYTATSDGQVVTLTDRQTDTVVTVVPSVGNIATGLTVKGHEVLRYQRTSLEDFRAQPGQTGIPFMGPWIGRLDEQAFYANGRRHAFDMALGNVRGEVPIHGFLTATDHWRVIALTATTAAAAVTSRLEVYRQPAWMRQWPYTHTVEITYRLADGVLEVSTAVANLSAEPMPISIGFHPYFQLTDSPRDEWQIAVAARTRWQLDQRKLPTGQTEPADLLLPPPRVTLREYSLDDVFSDLVRDVEGRSTTTLWGRQQRLDVTLGPRYRSVVVFAPNPSGQGRGGQGDSAPAERNFICIEPMAAIANALNLAQRGVYKELQSIAPGETWRESFWVRPSGF